MKRQRGQSKRGFGCICRCSASDSRAKPTSLRSAVSGSCRVSPSITCKPEICTTGCAFTAVPHATVADVDLFRGCFASGFAILSPEPSSWQEEASDPKKLSSNGRFLLMVLVRAVVASSFLFDDSGALLREFKAAGECPRSCQRERFAQTLAARAPCAIFAVKPAGAAAGKSVSKEVSRIALHLLGRRCDFARANAHPDLAERAVDP